MKVVLVLLVITVFGYANGKQYPSEEVAAAVEECLAAMANKGDAKVCVKVKIGDAALAQLALRLKLSADTPKWIKLAKDNKPYEIPDAERVKFKTATKANIKLIVESKVFLKYLMYDLSDTINAVVKLPGGKLTEGALNAAAQIITVIGQVASQIVCTVLQFLTQVVNQVLSVLSQILGTVCPTLSGLIGQLSPTVVDLLQQVIKVVGDLVEKITDAIQGLGSVG